MNNYVEKIVLEFPFTIGENEEAVTEVIFKRRLKGKDLKGIKANMGFDEMLQILSKLTGLQTHYFEEMDAKDLTICLNVVSDFLGVSPQIGQLNLG